jgi:hypothetical protein
MLVHYCHIIRILNTVLMLDGLWFSNVGRDLTKSRDKDLDMTGDETED